MRLIKNSQYSKLSIWNIFHIAVKLLKSSERGIEMKNKKIVSMVLAAGMLIGGTGFAPVKAMAATEEKVQVVQLTEKDIKKQAYSILQEIKTNPTEKNIKEARALLFDITDATYKSAYTYLLDLYVSKSEVKPSIAVDELLAASKMNQAITSSEQKLGLTVNLEGKDLSDEEKAALASILPIINALKLDVTAKSKASDNNMKAQVDGNIKLNMMGMAMDMDIWADVDATGSMPKMKMIVEIPEFIKMTDPSLKDKQYLVYDLEKLMKMSSPAGVATPDFSSMMNMSQSVNTKLTASFEEVLKIVDAKLNIVSKGDLSKVDAETAKNLSKVYNVNIDNDKLIQLIKLAVQDKEVKKVLKDYINSMLAVDPATKGQKLSDKDFEMMLAQMLPAVDMLNQIAKFDISLVCGVDKEGFMAYQAGSIKVTVSPAQISALMGQVQPGQTVNSKSTYTLTINFDSNTTNINKDIKIAPMPEVNEKNSIDLADTMTQLTTTAPSI